MLGAGGKGMILKRKKEIKLLSLRATVFHPCWDSRSRRADLATRRRVAKGLVREDQERRGPAGEPRAHPGEAGPLRGAQIRPGVHAAAAEVFPTRGLSGAGREVCKVYPKVSRSVSGPWDSLRSPDSLQGSARVARQTWRRPARASWDAPRPDSQSNVNSSRCYARPRICKSVWLLIAERERTRNQERGRERKGKKIFSAQFKSHGKGLQL